MSDRIYLEGLNVAGVVDEDANALVVDIVEQTIEGAVPRVPCKRADAIVDLGAFEMCLESADVFASLHVGFVGPAFAWHTPWPDVTVHSSWFAVFPGS